MILTLETFTVNNNCHIKSWKLKKYWLSLKTKKKSCKLSFANEYLQIIKICLNNVS